VVRRRPSNTVRAEGTPRSHARGSSTDFDDISKYSVGAHQNASGSYCGGLTTECGLGPMHGPAPMIQ
jgi:hypothetical protein